MPLMLHRRVRTWAFAVAGAVAFLIVSGVAAYAAMSGSAVSSTASDAVRKSTANINLSTVGATPTTIVSMTLPPGSWVVASEESAVNFGPSDYLRCNIMRGGASLVGNTTMVGDNSLPGAMGPGTYVATLGSIARFTSANSTTVSLACNHDTGTPSGNGPPYIDAGATLWAHKATKLG
jgi:hypothetical protein